LVIATSIKEGEEKLSELHSQGFNPDVFITDYHLPDGTSEKFVSRVKEAFPKIKVILCSSDDSAESVIKCDVSFSKGRVFEIKSKVEEFLKDGNQ
jgi:DNA-binding NarL/FixJ family response regulator